MAAADQKQPALGVVDHGADARDQREVRGTPAGVGFRGAMGGRLRSRHPPQRRTHGGAVAPLHSA